MAALDDLSIAVINRSLRAIRTELEFLTDASVITSEQLSSILSELPEHAKRTDVSSKQQEAAGSTAAQAPIAPYSPPTSQLANTTLNEKTTAFSNSQAYVPPPPAYPQVRPILSVATALYAYTPTDVGDLALQPHDRIQVLDHMNDDWWRGRNERTNLEGIFPCSYVRVIDDKTTPIVAPQPTGYGNMPLEISQSGSSSQRRQSKFEEQGKKFGKKMGNAAIFGAGATLGSNLVNSIF